MQAGQQAERCGGAGETPPLSSWNIDFTIILSLWTSPEDHGCQKYWRSGATLNSASRQNVWCGQVPRL
jgi:hypothetical protein